MLEVSNIVKEYDFNNEKKRVLDDISFSVADGEILGITGKSGCGKTTLLKILRGIENFDSGSFKLNDQTITSESDEDEIRAYTPKTAIHLQRNFAIWNGPAIENIIRRLNFHHAGDESIPHEDSFQYEEVMEEAQEYIKLVGLEDKALHTSSCLSGGEKQRLILARQLAAKPKLLLLDEPVTMTGPGTKQEMLDLIKEIKGKLNIPIIVVSHLPEVHMYLSDRLAYMKGGKIIETGETEKVLKNFLKDIDEQVPLTEIKEKEPVLKIRNLSNRFSLIRVGEVLKFEDLSLDINKGEITAIIGQSGSGKTSLLKMIEGLRIPKQGDISYLHEGEWLNIAEFTRQRLDLRKKISIMHQEFTLSPHSTVREQMGFRLRLKGKGSLDFARKRAAELGISDQALDTLYSLPDTSQDEKDKLLRQLNLTMDIYAKLFPMITVADVDQHAETVFETLDLPMEVLDKTPYQLSGGEHVRAYIALALATSPEILILDEPFGDLDPITLRDVTNSLKKVNTMFDTSIIFVSHHMDFVKEAAHRAILIDDAEIIMDGKPEDVCNKLIEMSHAKYLEHDLKELAE